MTSRKGVIMWQIPRYMGPTGAESVTVQQAREYLSELLTFLESIDVDALKWDGHRAGPQGLAWHHSMDRMATCSEVLTSDSEANAFVRGLQLGLWAGMLEPLEAEKSLTKMEQRMSAEARRTNVAQRDRCIVARFKELCEQLDEHRVSAKLADEFSLSLATINRVVRNHRTPK